MMFRNDCRSEIFRFGSGYLVTSDDCPGLCPFGSRLAKNAIAEKDGADNNGKEEYI
jgi:hypothetical protein